MLRRRPSEVFKGTRRRLGQEVTATGKKLTAAEQAAPFSKVRRPEIAAPEVAIGLTKTDVARVPGLKRGIKASEKVQGAALQAAQEAGGLRRARQLSSQAPLGTRLAVAEQIGKTIPTLGPEAGGVARTVNALRQIKRQAFGPGASAAAQLRAGAAQRGTAGARLAGELTRRKFAGILQPVVQKITQQTGRSADDVMARLVDLVETSGGVKKFSPVDPIQTAIFETMQQFGRQDDVIDAVKQFKKFADDAFDAQVRRGVSPGKRADFFKRTATQEFQQASGPEVRRLGGKARTSPRVQRIDFQAPTGEITTTTTSNANELAGLRARAAAGELEEIGQFDISTRQFNVSPGERGFSQGLTPKGFQGAQFRTDVPEIAGAILGPLVGGIFSLFGSQLER